MAITRRGALAATLTAAGTVGAPAILRTQPTVIRWGDRLPANHPQLLMVERLARELRERTSGRLEI